MDITLSDGQPGPSSPAQPLLAGPSASPPDHTGDGTSSRVKRRRTRNGCLPCRKRKKLCDEEKPTCGACERLVLTCEWEDKMQAALERRRRRIERAQEREREREAAAGRAQGPLSVSDGLQDGGTVGQEGWPQTSEGVLLWPPGSEGFATPLPAVEPVPGYDPADPGLTPLPSASLALPLPFPAAPHAAPSPWSSMLGPGYAALGGSVTDGPLVWPTSFPTSTEPFLHQPSLPLPPDLAGMSLDLATQSTSTSPPFDLFSLLRSPSPSVNPFASTSTAATLDGLNLPFSLSDPSTQLAASHAAVGDLPLVPNSGREQALARSPDRRVGQQPLPLVSQAASLLASSDFAFTQSYLLSHYTTSLARLVSIASSSSTNPSPSTTSPSSASRSRPRPSTSPTSGQKTTSSSSTRASANLFLSLVPLAKRHPYLLHAICAWSAANLAAASSASRSDSAAPSSSSEGDNPVMARLSEQLGILADSGLNEALPALEAHASTRGDGAGADSGNDEPPWEAMLAARLMQVQAAICSGSVELWRVRMRDAAKVVELAGGVRACCTPLSRQLLKNLLYHDVLSSSSTREGLLVDYASLVKPSSSTMGASGDGETAADEEQARRDDEDDEEEALDTLMGVSEPVFHLLGAITHLAKEKRQASCRDGAALAEDELEAFLSRVDAIKSELEREKERMDGFLLGRPDLEPHRYFHETFRLAALLYCEMILEQPPRALPVLLLVRKMLNLTELIVEESLPGLPSMHYPLFLMHLNSTPLRSPRAASTDRERSTRMFDVHQEQLGYFGNTKRSRTLLDEAWRRSLDGRVFVDHDSILAEWGWELNFA
ncbi:uncharacterized protein RHOBADRAFT_54699 [Rhodotorula graminis WP1]|uniref:Zn(2)-C6 fungal-type domain-containing protein n=1 Tax=Rhodotorula graminis (strain WP1) TaxID=578459 RepID=A0A0P9ENA4_RHOGW|nr:uncharacterized protein RHOBADRAFT_54699 [Rhodotorula graminis WP1]KPV73479.1 hypothetical protein RHOBADRAFT_54699 [Rhodotorula graminis WP1]